MNLYLLKRIGEADYGEYQGFVIRSDDGDLALRRRRRFARASMQAVLANILLTSGGNQSTLYL